MLRIQSFLVKGLVYLRGGGVPGKCSANFLFVQQHGKAGEKANQPVLLGEIFLDIWTLSTFERCIEGCGA